MTFRLLFPIASFLTMLLTSPVLGQTWQEQFDVVESLVERQQTNSADSLLEQTIAEAETQFSRSDSTVDIKFFREGVSYRVYFGSFSESEQLYTELVAISEKLYGSASLEFAVHLRKLAAVYVTLGRYREAESAYRRALAAAEQASGPNSKETAGILNDLGGVLCTLAKYEEADSAAQKALMIGKDIYGFDHPSVARSLQMVGLVHLQQAAYTEADSLFRLSLKILEDRLGPDHPDVASSLILLAEYYLQTGLRRQAINTLARVLEITEAALGPNHPEVAYSLCYLVQYRDGSDREKLAVRAFSILENTFGPDHPWTAAALLMWAVEKIMLNRPGDAEAKARKALPVLEEAFGHNHPAVALALEKIAVSKYHMNQFADAVAYFKQAEAILTTRTVPDTRLANVYNYLFGCYFEMGLEDKADSVMTQLDTIATTTGNSMPAGYASLMLGMAYLMKGQPAEGRDMLNRALAISDSISSEVTNLKLMTQRTLAASWVQDQEYAKAEILVRQVLPTLKDWYGPESVAYSATLGQLGEIYMLLGKFPLAKETLLESLSIKERTGFPYGWETTYYLDCLGAISAAEGKYDESVQFYRRCLAVKQRTIQMVFASSSESQKVWQLSRYPIFFDEVFSLATTHGASESRRLALDICLKEKAIVEEAAMVERQVAYCQHDDATKNRLDLFREVCTAVANMTLSGGADPDSLRTLHDVHDSLEMVLSQSCAQFKDDLALSNFEVSDVAASVPEEAVLLEFFMYSPVKFDSAYFWDIFEEPHYMALTLDAGDEISVRDLGPAGPVDSLVSLARDLVYDAQGMMHSTKASVAETMLSDVTAQLRELVLDPLMEQLDGKTSLYVSPDGMLNLFPFEILPMPDESYLIEKFRVSYLSSGRDLLRYRQQAETSDDVVVMADPDFDRSAPSLSTAEGEQPPQPLAQLLRGTGECLEGPVGRLSHSLAEGNHVAESFRKLSARPVLELYGQEASEVNLKQMNPSPGVLHLATHGYFCPYSEDLPPSFESPLLRSGLVLAGYNSTISNVDDWATSGEDGILTAYEVSGLNLNGTELVTLSACESGMAEGYTCEGFYGLRRAFQHAGAQSVVMSLWKVPDRETKLLMAGFYDRWLSGSTKKDALRESALELLRTCREELGCAHPLLWGGFVLTGNPN